MNSPWTLLWPQGALAAGALAVLGIGMARSSSQAKIKGTAATAVAVAMVLLACTKKAACPPLLRLEPLGWALQFVFLAAALPLIHTTDADDEVPAALLLGCLIGMGLLAASGNLLLLFIGLESMSLPAYLLVSRSRSRGALEASVKYFFAGSAAGALFIMGLALHYAAAGSLTLQAAPGPLGEAGLALMGTAALFKLGAVPLHFWLPDAYEASDPELAAFLSTAMKAAAALLLLRLTALSPHGAFAAGLPWVGALTILFGAAVALRQVDLLRLLAYSSIAHAGVLILAVAAWAVQDGTAAAAAAVLFYLAAYLFMSSGAFLWLRWTGIARRSQLSGLSRTRPAQAAALTILLLALAGIPPTAGFVAKFLVFWEMFKAGLIVPLVLAGLGALLALGYYLGLVRDMYFEAPVPGDPIGPPDVPNIRSLQVGDVPNLRISEVRDVAPGTAGRGMTTAGGWVLACAAAAMLLGLTPWLVDLK
jgi:NADH-quinone oxidoreductase subunit N